MPDYFPKADLDEARRLGQVSGGLSKKQVADCPYRHDALPLRGAWIAGFSEGRVRITPAGLFPALANR